MELEICLNNKTKAMEDHHSLLCTVSAGEAAERRHEMMDRLLSLWPREWERIQEAFPGLRDFISRTVQGDEEAATEEVL